MGGGQIEPIHDLKSKSIQCIGQLFPMTFFCLFLDEEVGLLDQHCPCQVGYIFKPIGLLWIVISIKCLHNKVTLCDIFFADAPMKKKN